MKKNLFVGKMFNFFMFNVFCNIFLVLLIVCIIRYEYYGKVKSCKVLNKYIFCLVNIYVLNFKSKYKCFFYFVDYLR